MSTQFILYNIYMYCNIIDNFKCRPFNAGSLKNTNMIFRLITRDVNFSCIFLNFQIGISFNELYNTRYCGDETPAPYITNNRILFVSFVTDSTLGLLGFRLQYNFIECGLDVICCKLVVYSYHCCQLIYI